MRYLITGGSGYIGSRLIEILALREETERIVALDVRPSPRPQAKTMFVRADVRDAKAIRELLDRVQPDALVHLAFLLNPIRDEARMYDIDVNGTEAVLRAAAEAGTKQVLVTSSATAYGAFPDNPKPIAEDWPVRGQPEFSYARHKAEADRALPALGTRASGPRDDDRPPLHRIRAERRQLHLAKLGELGLHARNGRCRRGVPARARGRRGQRDHRPAGCEGAAAPSTSPATAP